MCQWRKFSRRLVLCQWDYGWPMNWKSRNVLQRKNTGNRFSCEVCSKKYSSRDNLKQHMETQTGGYRYHCHVCRKGFNTTINFRNNMRAHEGLKYHCGYCLKHSFPSKGTKNTFPLTNLRGAAFLGCSSWYVVILETMETIKKIRKRKQLCNNITRQYWPSLLPS